MLVLTVLNGEHHGEVIPLQDHPLLIGRDLQCDLRLTDPTVSRHHCWVEPEQDGHLVRDLGSANGTWLNGIRIRATATLRPGDLLRLGRTRLLIADVEAFPSHLPGWPNLRFDPQSGRVWRDEIPIDPPLSPVQTRLLAALWEHAGEPMPPDALATRLWPEAPPEETKPHLARLVERLRVALYDTDGLLVQQDGEGYVLLPSPKIAATHWQLHLNQSRTTEEEYPNARPH